MDGGFNLVWTISCKARCEGLIKLLVVISLREREGAGG